LFTPFFVNDLVFITFPVLHNLLGQLTIN